MWGQPLFCSQPPSEFAYNILARLTRPLLSSQRRCCAATLSAALIMAVIPIIKYCDTIWNKNTTFIDAITLHQTCFGRVINIPLTEASDSPKIAAWHMVPTEVTTFHPFYHLLSHFQGHYQGNFQGQQTDSALSTWGGSYSGVPSQGRPLQGGHHWLGSLDRIAL